MLFSLFVRNADMPAGLSFLLIFYESSILKSQRSKCRLISFARLRTGASALYFLVYEWIFLKENNDIDVGLGKHAF